MIVIDVCPELDTTDVYEVEDGTDRVVFVEHTIVTEVVRKYTVNEMPQSLWDALERAEIL